MTRRDPRPATEAWLATPEAAGLLDPARLDPAERLAWNGLHTSRRRLDWASSRALRQALSGDQREDWNSSLSHSHGYAALARTCRRASIGVDLEWLAPRDFLGIAGMAFTPDEARELESLGDQEQVCTRFYELWTLKEAFGKALGLPLADALAKCCFAGTGAAAAARFPRAGHWQAVVYAPRPLLRLAVVVAGDAARPAALEPTTMEWPPRRAVAWPVVRRVDGVGAGC